MLRQMRGGAHGFLAQILLGLLVMSFAVWGIGDMLRSPASNSIAVVGGHALSTQAFEREYRNEEDRMRAMLGARATPEMLSALGLPRQVAERQVVAELLRLETQNLGLLPDDATVARAIRRDPQFQNAKGAFDRNLFQEALRRAGIRETDYADDVRLRLGKNLLVQGLSTVTPIDDAMASVLYAAEHELRSADAYVFSPALVPMPPPPDDAALQALYKQQQATPEAADFTVPELRSLSYIAVPKEMLGGDEDKAAAALSAKLQDALAGGATLPEAAQSLGLTVKTVGPLDATGHAPGGGWPKNLPDWGNFLQVSFALQEGAQSKLTRVAGQDGYFLVQADKVEPEHVKPFDEIKPALAKLWQSQERGRQLRAKAEDAAKQLAAAKDDAARKTVLAGLGLTPVATGALARTSEKTASGQALPLPLVKELFTRKVGEATGVFPQGDTYMLAVARSRAPGPAAKPAELQAFKDKLADTARQEMLADYLQYLHNKYSVVIHQPVLDAYGAPAS